MSLMQFLHRRKKATSRCRKRLSNVAEVSFSFHAKAKTEQFHHRFISVKNLLRTGECSRFVLTVPEKQQEQGRNMRVLGIDPGLRNMGWGVIDTDGVRMTHVANGVVHSVGTELPERLLSLHEQLTDVLTQYQPDSAAVEQTFVNKDGVGTLKLGQARGIALLVPAQAGLSVGEYAPNKVKKTVVGVGHADKRQVDHMVRLQLPGCEIAGPDAADALAVALCHAYYARSGGSLEAALKRAV